MENLERRQRQNSAHSFLLSDEELSQGGENALVLKSPTLAQEAKKSTPASLKNIVTPEPNSHVSASSDMHSPSSPKMDAQISKIFNNSFMPALRSTSSISSTSSPTPPSTAAPGMVSVDINVMQKLLSRIDTLETKLETISSQPPTSSGPTVTTTDDQSLLSAFTQQTTQSVNDVSMGYRVLTPPSSITGGISSSDSSSSTPTRRRSRHESDLIENLASKIDTNHEHLTRLDHVVQAQEETIRRQQETLHNMLANPELLSLAPLRIQRFMKSVSLRKRKRKVRAANIIKRSMLAHKHTSTFQKYKSSAILIQKWYRCFHHRHAFVEAKSNAIVLQAVIRGNNVRRPLRVRTLYNHYTTNLKILAIAEGKVRALEKQCPITMSPINTPIICISDGHTYEKSAITTWVKRNGSSPLTREPVTTQDLILPENLVEKLKRTRTSLEKTTRQSIIYKLERDNLQQSHAMTKMKFTLSANEVDELKVLLEKESSDLLKTKAEIVKLKQELASMSAKTDAVESDNAELRKRLNSASHRARSVQYERDEFQVQMASLTAKADTLNAEVEQNDELHERLLDELKEAQTSRTKGNAALLLQMAVAQKNSRSLLEETVWHNSSDSCDGYDAQGEQQLSSITGDQSHPTYRSGLEEGTWDDNESDQESDDEERDTDDIQKVKLQVVEGSRSSLEDDCWIFKPMELIKRTFDSVALKELKELIKSNRIKEMGIDQRTAEFLLSDKQFVNTFGIEKKEYSRLPKWKKLSMKREVELF